MSCSMLHLCDLSVFETVIGGAAARDPYGLIISSLGNQFCVHISVVAPLPILLFALECLFPLQLHTKPSLDAPLARPPGSLL